MIRIAWWVRTGNKFGGFERYLLQFSELCLQRNVKFYIFNEIENTSPEYLSFLGQNGVEVITIGESSKEPINVIRRVIGLVRQHNIDILHLHFIHPIYGILLKLMDVPLVYLTLHSGIDHKIGFKTKFPRWLSNYFITRFFAVSERVRNDAILSGVKSEKISVSYLGLPKEIFFSQIPFLDDPKPPYYNNKNKQIIISVGRFFLIKGMRYVVEAAINVVNKSPNVIWWIVGKEGPESQTCFAMVEKSSLEDKIFFLGERNDIPALVNVSSIMVMGSISEGFGLAALEASVLGVPTIGPNIHGLDEIIVNGKSGILVEPKSGAALADATLKLVENQILRRQMGDWAVNYAIKKFDSIKYINEILDTYFVDFQNNIRIKTNSNEH